MWVLLIRPFTVVVELDDECCEMKKRVVCYGVYECVADIR